MRSLNINLSILISVCLASFTHSLLNITLPAQLYSDTSLPCRIPMDRSSNVNVRWFSLSHGWLTSGRNVYKFRNQISVIKPAPNEWNLHIKKISQTFADTYTCETDMGEKLSIITIVIEIPPRIDDRHSSSITEKFQEYTTAILTCAVSGIPEPDITWYRGESETDTPSFVATGITGSELKIRATTRYATGEYICRAKNKNGEAERRITVTINFHPEVEVMKRVVYASGGELVVMSCVVQASPLYSAYWTRGSNANGNSSPIKSNWKYLVLEDEGGDDIPVKFLTLIIHDNTITSHDYGTYTCVALGENREAQASVELRGNG